MRKILIIGFIFYTLSNFSIVKADNCDKEHLDLCIRGVSLSVTSIDSLRLSSVSILNEDYYEDKEELETGLAAGDNGSWGLWGNAMTSNFEGDYHFNQTSLAYSAKQSSYTTGLDFFIDSMIFGLSMGYEKTTTKTNFNNGRAVKKGFTIAPYFAYLLNDQLSFDSSIGYSQLNNTQNRIDPFTGSRVTSDVNSRRYFYNFNLNYNQSLTENSLLNITTGLMHMKEKIDQYKEVGNRPWRVTATDIFLTQALVGLDLTFISDSPLETHIFSNYIYDFENKSYAGGLPRNITRITSKDKDAFELGMGINYFHHSGFTASLELLAIVGRQDYTNKSLMLTLRQEL